MGTLSACSQDPRTKGASTGFDDLPKPNLSVSQHSNKKKQKKERDFTSRSLPKAQICLTELRQAACLDLTEGLSNQPEGLSSQRMGVVDHRRGLLHLDSSRRLPLPHLNLQLRQRRPEGWLGRWLLCMYLTIYSRKVPWKLELTRRG